MCWGEYKRGQRLDKIKQQKMVLKLLLTLELMLTSCMWIESSALNKKVRLSENC